MASKLWDSLFTGGQTKALETGAQQGGQTRTQASGLPREQHSTPFLSFLSVTGKGWGTPALADPVLFAPNPQAPESALLGDQGEQLPKGLHSQDLGEALCP